MAHLLDDHIFCRGPHFLSLHTVYGSKVNYLGRQLVTLHNEYVARLREGAIEEKFVHDWKRHIDFFIMRLRPYTMRAVTWQIDHLPREVKLMNYALS